MRLDRFRLDDKVAIIVARDRRKTSSCEEELESLGRKVMKFS